MAQAFNWRCPHCQRYVTITNTISGGQTTVYHDNADGRHTLYTTFIVCPNPECEKFTLEANLHVSSRTPNGERLGDVVKHWRLVPPSNAKVFPEYIPKPLIDDYTEACLIKEYSPKASATLSRRCLQGIIRDYWRVKPGRLVDEIEAIKDKTDHLTWEAIDAVRKVGNIGAHMEKDINLIVDVDPNEAELLINLIEMLFQDWYVTREERKNRLEAIVDIGSIKAEAKKGKNS
ncbi:hypothetical protein CWC26_00905 [Pseudoalteromonas sp. S4488]|uniref:DUF4145 domain-containing protein n=1 Tax=unclassified Pseudoalteromonas TaxID=194690 RepID=UPI001023CB9F|nr:MULTISPECIES: DUF4145 domain-containing protein [unclassified Pseudoalteromonas]RZF78253.1 DUF4145 domain-containing protein [Pseudoalteromonas sp. CO109Y]TMO35485.1 hypothetical protein CWC27_10440 [Pseudoalteromonas sp. S4491]TMO41610.1 hypothetical protein CWC26_00905 [Pseudoalteromonas sp. S4488]